MPAYIIVEVDVKDQARYPEYRAMVPSSLEKYGGRFVVRGGASETLEGGWQPKRLVVIEFASVEQAKRWWDSPEYADAKRLRQEIADTRMVVVEGV